MFQEFNKVTTTSNFIKNLLLSTYLPLVRTVRDYDYILKNRLYVYKCKVIKCTKSGYIIVGGQNILDPRPRATFDVQSEYHFGERNDKLCTNFMSSTEGYDYLTHERLGKYLRNLRDMYDLNLMPLYNCFSNQPLGRHHIYNDRVTKTDLNFNTKTYKVPIRFNTDYTICMENLGMTTFAPAFVKNNNLIKADNTRFGNGTDLTNQYIKLHRGDVIINKPNLRFKHPIKIRFDNIPQTKVVRYNTDELIPFDTHHSDTWYRQVVGKIDERSYSRSVDKETGIITYNYYSGDISFLSPGDTLFPGENLFPRAGDDTVLYESINPSIGAFEVPMERYTTVSLKIHCSSILPYNADETYFEKSKKTRRYNIVSDMTKELYDANPERYFLAGGFNGEPTKYYKLAPTSFLTPSDTLFPNDELYPYIGDPAEGYENYPTFKCKFVPCSENEAFNMNLTYAVIEEDKLTWREKRYIYTPIEVTEAMFSVFKTSYWILKDGEYIQCTSESVYDPNETYYTRSWELVDTTDTWIHLDKEYYPRYAIQTEHSYTYDITEENCSWYDSMENNLYLLIQVPEVFDSNILVLEGDYTRTSTEKICDDTLVEMMPPPLLDRLYTSNLKLMEVGTTQIIPFSNTLMEFLTWNAISSLDDINNNMDRVAVNLSRAMDEVYRNDYENFWNTDYRKRVYDLGRNQNTMYVVDNLGYVTRTLENIMNTRSIDYGKIHGIEQELEYESEIDIE